MFNRQGIIQLFKKAFVDTRLVIAFSLKSQAIFKNILLLFQYTSFNCIPLCLKYYGWITQTDYFF